MHRPLILSMLITGILLPGMVVTINVNFNLYVKDCVSGEMLVEELTKGTIRASQLSIGDIIPGGAEWKPREGDDDFTNYDGFTADHMVIDADIVRPYGNSGNVKKTRLYMLATECDAAVNAAGQASNQHCILSS